MLDINSFDQVFAFNPAHSYPGPTVTLIQANRKRLGGRLFVERLFAVLGVEPSVSGSGSVSGSVSASGNASGNGNQSKKEQQKHQHHKQQQQHHHHHPSLLYPPHTNTDLRNLHSRIVSSPNADHHKQALLFYLLKDCQTKPRDDFAHQFASGCYLPQKYWVCVEGLWEMDRRHFAVAMDFLTQPSLIPTFAEEILHVLLLHVANDNDSNNSSSNNSSKDTAKDLHLPLTYYQSVSPGITSPEIRDAYFTYLARLSITEAYNFARAQHPRPVRLHLLQLLAASALAPSPGTNDGNDHRRRPARGLELVDLPFDEEEEEELFVNYLLRGKGRALPGAKDTVLMRWVAMGDMQRVLSLGTGQDGHHAQARLGGGGGGGGGRKHDGVNWDTVREGIERGLGGRRDVGSLYSG